MLKTELIAKFLLPLLCWSVVAHSTTGQEFTDVNLKCFNFNSSFELAKVPVTVNGASGSQPFNDPTRGALATVLDRFQSLGGNMDLVRNLKVNTYFNGREGKCTNWTAGAHQIDYVAACTRDGVLTPRSQEEAAINLTHEIGHTIGLQGGTYNDYFNANPQVCAISHYSTENTNSNPRKEEFGEVFLAYMANPADLQTKCPNAYSYFQKKFFPGSARSASPDAKAACHYSGNPDNQTYMSVVGWDGHSSDDPDAPSEFKWPQFGMHNGQFSGLDELLKYIFNRNAAPKVNYINDGPAEARPDPE